MAEPCLEIEKNPQDAYKYTAKGNLVAVISNGTAVLGLGDIGALSGKPVMEGKGLLFKIYAGIDVFDIEVNEKAPEKAELLLEIGMHCLGCPASQMETLEEACAVHGIDVNEVIEKLKK